MISTNEVAESTRRPVKASQTSLPPGLKPYRSGVLGIPALISPIHGVLLVRAMCRGRVTMSIPFDLTYLTVLSQSCMAVHLDDVLIC